MSQRYGPSPFEYRAHKCSYCGSPCALPWVREGKKYCSQKCLLDSGNGPKMRIERYGEKKMLEVDESKIVEHKSYAVCGKEYAYRKDAVRYLHVSEFKDWVSSQNYAEQIYIFIAANKETIQQFYESQSTTSDRDVLEKAVEVLNKAYKEYAVLNKADKDYAVRVLRHLNTALNHDSI